VVCYKDQGERRLAAYLASYLAATIPAPWRTWADALVFIPADRAAKRRRGFDHMEEVAEEVASLTGLLLFNLLEKLPATDQRKLGRGQRYENLQQAFLVSGQAGDDNGYPLPARQANPLPQNIILIDDVLTTGATLDAAAAALLACGAKEVRVVTVARVW